MSAFPELWIIFAVLAVALPLPGESELMKPHVCLTEECQEIAQMYAETMNETVDPCENFYKYSCGGWASKNLIPDYVAFWDRSISTHRAHEKLLKSMLESPPEVTDILPIQQAKTFYQSCMDIAARNASIVNTIASFLESNGGWPMAMNFHDWKEDDRSWQEVDANFENLTTYYAFYNFIGAKGPWLRMLPPMDNEILNNSKILYLVDLIIRHNHANVSAAQLKSDIDDLFIFDQKLGEARENGSQWKLQLQNLTTFILEWEKKIQSEPDPKTVVNWKEMIQRWAFTTREIPGGITLEIDRKYYFSLPEIWRNTTKRTIVNYIHWQFVNRIFGEAPKETGDEDSELDKLLRWLDCMNATTMYEAHAHWFVEHYFTETNQKAVQEVVKYIKEGFIYQIEKSNLMDNSSKSALKRKLEKMEILIGRPDWIQNRTEIESYYENLNIGDDYVTNRLNFRRFEKKYGSLAAERSESSRWFMHILQPTAAYHRDWNVANIPAGFFHLPFFNSEAPDFVNYGALGNTISHEIGHGFDNQGIRDRTSTRNPVRDYFMLFNYKIQLECIEDQFRNYFKSDSMVAQTMSENVADLIATQLMLASYDRAKQAGKANVTVKLPGFEKFTDDQMLFIAFAQTHCQVTPDNYKDESDVHSPPELRVNVGVSNVPRFGAAFSCTVGSPMNAAKKCTIWEKRSSSLNDDR
ncbi:membrane metallo-endopeptidase-like 1 [Diachasma alloeum]|uniref:membrane metallo-endopeptidase-like 1 n=1 Tax=Diachasma alloeum TaxID=454923 RepID=UPI0007383D96|nr:membrane metallo-endopeptidase-like 1 [Diachasma alloeum]